MIKWRCPCRKILQRCSSNISTLPIENRKHLDNYRDSACVELDIPVEALKSLPKLEPMYSVDTGLTPEDYDSNGELKPLLPEEIVLEINSRWSLATPSFPYEPLPESTGSTWSYFGSAPKYRRA